MTNTLTTTIEATVSEEITEEVAPTQFEIPAYNLDEFKSRVAKANNRLERAGSDARFVFTYEDFQRRKITSNENVAVPVTSAAVYEPWVRATLVGDSFRIAIGDYTFVARLVAEEAGYTIHTAPGQNLDGWIRPAVDDIHCGHCNTVRNRINIFIVRNNETGELVQLDQQCIALYLGFSPKSLWALTFTDSLSDLSEASEGGFSAYRDYSAEIDAVLATAFAYSNKGTNYVSTARGGDWPGAPVPTVGKVRAHIFQGRPERRRRSRRLGLGFFGLDEVGYQKAVAEYDAKVVEIAAFLADKTLIPEIKASVETVQAGTDYGDNLRIILAAPSGIVGGKNVGILASLVSVYAREKELAVKREQEAKTPKAQGFLADVGTRIKTEIELTLTVVRTKEGDYGWSTWMVGTTPDGHVVSWNASKLIDVWSEDTNSWKEVEVGDKLVLSAATVKAHENYKGTDQTVITRAKIKEA